MTFSNSKGFGLGRRVTLTERAAERGYIDGAIMPHATRKSIARALAMLRNKHIEWPVRKHDNLTV